MGPPSTSGKRKRGSSRKGSSTKKDGEAKPEKQIGDLASLWKNQLKKMSEEQKLNQMKKDLKKEGKKKEILKEKKIKTEVEKIKQRKGEKTFDDKKKLKRQRHKDNKRAKLNLERQQQKSKEDAGKSAPKAESKAQKPAASNVVWVGGLDAQLKSAEVRTWFENKCGPCKKVFIMRPGKDEATTYGFVHFQEDAAAQKALGLAGKKFSDKHTHRLKVHLSTGKDSNKKPAGSLGDEPSPPPPEEAKGPGPMPKDPPALKAAVLGELTTKAQREAAKAAEEAELEQELKELNARRAAKKRKLNPEKSEGGAAPAPAAKVARKDFKAKWPGHEDDKAVDKQKYLKDLEGGTFRMLNEMFCTSSSADAKKFFEVSPEMFETYHSGYRTQVKKWPVNPLDIIIEDLKKYKKGYPQNTRGGAEKHYADTQGDDAPMEEDGQSKGIPRYWQICDLGCGEAQLALEMSNNKVLSYDLYAVNDRVTVADIAHVPADSFSCEVAVLCLALLGTNYIDYIREAYRILTHRGLLKICELSSRILAPELFVNLMKILGFWCLRMERVNDVFWLFDFQKRNDPVHDVKKRIQQMNLAEILKPFKYKKR